MAEQSVEERLTQIEHRVAELERQRGTQDDRDLALLARIDGFIDDLRRVERVQMRGFDDLKADVRELQAGQKNLETAVGVIVETLQDHKKAIESLAGQMNAQAGQINTLTVQVSALTSQVKDQASVINTLAAGQAQILAILTGQSPLVVHAKVRTDLSTKRLSVRTLA
jgi:chromosome segregation ATPase